MNYRNLMKAGLLIFSLNLFVACSTDQDDDGGATAEMYNTSVEVTDAPIDNANVKGAFVTITKVKVNGKALQGFKTTTVDLLALQNGKTKALGNVDLKSGATSSIALEFNNEVDANGNAPGNYILTAAGEKKALIAASGEIFLTKAAEVQPSNDNSLVLDFDLRKLISQDSQTKEFRFVSAGEMQASIRAVNRLKAGTVKGAVEGSSSTANEIVVYAYKKGSYSSSEKNESNGGVRFAGAVNSAIVNKSNGQYSLHFLEEGEYEFHFASYSRNSSGDMKFEGMLSASIAGDLGLNLAGLNVNAESTTTANVIITGLL